MCGDNTDLKNISTEQDDFYKKLSAHYDEVFGQNQAITGALTSAFLPILQAGPSQTGFSQGQENALRTQNVENVATDYGQAQRATAQILAARGGGNTLLPSSVDANILAQNTNAAAQARSTGDLGITNANYAQGYQNWNTAANVLGSTAGLLNPTGYSGVANTAGSDAAATSKAAADVAFAPWGAAFGALGSIGGAAASYGMGKLPCWIAAEIFGGWEDPRTVTVRHWLMKNYTGHWLMNLYVQFGERMAAMVRKHRPVRWVFTGIFNHLLKQAQVD